MADQAEAAGMDVRRVFFPHATWDNVLANIQGANLVVYMGHGYGWPSPYTQQLTESRQNGMGLNSFDGSGADQYTYYGANALRENVVLAPNAVVYPEPPVLRRRQRRVGHGHSERGPRPPARRQHGQRLAGHRRPRRFRVRLEPAAQLSTGAGDVQLDGGRAVHDAGTGRRAVAEGLRRLARQPASTSERTPAPSITSIRIPSEGYYRAVTGDLSMTTAEWRSGAGSGDDPPPPPPMRATHRRSPS